MAGEVFSERRKFPVMKRIAFLVGILTALALLPSAANAQYKQIIVATGSPFELGLVDALAKVFEKETGCIVRCIKTPTGPGLELGRQGLTHITMGHHPAATKKFVQDGFAAKRTDLMYNLTVIGVPKGTRPGSGEFPICRMPTRKLPPPRRNIFPEPMAGE
jgi:tungstate transport system substrate-binding protein